MSAPEKSDTAAPPSHGSSLRGVFADLDTMQVSSQSPRLPSWSFPPAPAANPPSSPPRPGTPGVDRENLPLFSAPSQSTFCSDLSSPSVSRSLAPSSMTAHPLEEPPTPRSNLSSPLSCADHRTPHDSGEDLSSVRKPRVSRPQKDVDDLSTPAEKTAVSFSRGTTTPTALTRLFAAPEPSISRHASYVRTPSGTTYTRG